MSSMQQTTHYMNKEEETNMADTTFAHVLYIMIGEKPIADLVGWLTFVRIYIEKYILKMTLLFVLFLSKHSLVYDAPILC